VADDGSRSDTRELIERVREEGYPSKLVHAWQPDAGFRQARAMNLGVLHSQGAHIIFTDGDCVPTRDMVAQHMKVSHCNTLVVGGHVRLGRESSRRLDLAAIRAGHHEALVSLSDRLRMWRWHLKNVYYSAVGAKRRPKIYGLNMAIGREAFVRLNGFDLAYQDCARQDSDLRNRARLMGVVVRSIWHRCIPVHLWHPEHEGRNGWQDADAYYRRESLEPVAVRGLRQLAEETGMESWFSISEMRHDR